MDFGIVGFDRAAAVDEDGFRDFKVAKTDQGLLKTQRSNLSEPHQQHMLSFSFPNSQPPGLPYFYSPTGITTRNSGNMQGAVSGVRGPFTPSQWMELEHQALIYKYITASVPIPSYLLNPIRKAFQSVAYSAFPALRSNPLGWGGFHLGYCNTDPEPGRCRRTDGKKWRCSRDAVADQKYCERHMNRGRHRSRKPVEGQSGHPSSGIVAAAKNGGGKPNLIPPSAPAGSASNGLILSHHHLQPVTNNAAKRQDAYQECTRPDFGLVCSDSLINPLGSFNEQENRSEHSLRQFIDDWPKNQAEQTRIAWPDGDLQPDRATQLSISMSDFTSPPASEKLVAAPVALSQGLEMGLAVGTTAVNSQRQAANWVPISWEPPMGGPLGEVLHTTGECKSAKPLNLMDSWEGTSRLASSPTGVLQRGAFGSLSNSSAGSSPRAAECSKALDGGVIRCTGLIAPGPLMNPSLPAL